MIDWILFFLEKACWLAAIFLFCYTTVRDQ